MMWDSDAADGRAFQRTSARHKPPDRPPAFKWVQPFLTRSQCAKSARLRRGCSLVRGWVVCVLACACEVRNQKRDK